MSKIRTPDDGGEDYFYKRGKSRSYGTPYNLTKHRFRGPILSPGEEADLLRAARAGDDAAKDKLVRSFHRKILKLVPEFYGPPRDDQFTHDLISAGLEGLWEAIRRCSLRRNNKLWAYAEHWVRKHMNLVAQGYLKLNRAERVVFSNPSATPGQIAALTTRLLCSNKRWAAGVKAAQEAIQKAKARRYSESYDVTEGGSYGKDRDGNEDYGDYTAPPAASSSDMYKMYDCYGSSQLSPHLRFHECISRWVDELGAWHDRQATRLLRWMGRRRYANVLAKRDMRPIPKPEIYMAEYSISINTAATASDSSGWMSDADRIEAASRAQQPLVWSQKVGGVWRVIDQRPKFVVVATQSEKETTSCPPTPKTQAA